MALGIYSAAAFLSAQDKQYALASRNIASSSQTGSRQLIMGLETQHEGKVSLPDSFDSVLSGSLPKETVSVNLTQGAIRITSNPYNIAISGDGFFEVQMPDGQSLYTRNGDFRVNSDLALVDSYGRAVLGTDGPIQLLDGGGDFYCDRNGELFQGSTRIGKIAVLNIPANDLVPVGGGFIINPDKGTLATPVENPLLVHKGKEDGNHSISDGMVDLVTISRQQEVVQQMIKVNDEQDDKVIRTFGKI
jgi:flagellar basal-body rod protein FlgF